MRSRVSESGGDGGSSSLVYPASGTTGLTQTQAAADANYSINGFPATSANNVVSGAISGVTLDLLGAIRGEHAYDLDHQCRHHRGVDLDRHVRHGRERRAERDPESQRLRCEHADGRSAERQRHARVLPEPAREHSRAGQVRQHERRGFARRPRHHGGRQHRTARFEFDHANQRAERQLDRSRESAGRHQRHRHPAQHADQPVLRVPAACSRPSTRVCNRA